MWRCLHSTLNVKCDREHTKNPMIIKTTGKKLETLLGHVSIQLVQFIDKKHRVQVCDGLNFYHNYVLSTISTTKRRAFCQQTPQKAKFRQISRVFGHFTTIAKNTNSHSVFIYFAINYA